MTQALSESPQLRRAAGAAATAVSAAAGTARVQFTYTSRTIGKVSLDLVCIPRHMDGAKDNEDTVSRVVHQFAGRNIAFCR